MTRMRFVLVMLLSMAGAAYAAGIEAPQELPGRQVRVCAVAIGCGGEHDAKLKLALDHLDTAGANKVDIVCLPEMFAGETPEPMAGPTVTAVAAAAKKYGMWVVCPIRESAGSEVYNTAVLINRAGEIAGYYRKIFVFWAEDTHASREGVRVFDTDFGRISIFTCFDLNFGELWAEAARLGAELVMWPSAYGGGYPLNAQAMLNGYGIVATGRGTIIDAAGVTLADVEKPRPDQFIATLDLDRTFVHKDYNYDKVDKLLHDHAGEVELERDCDMEGWFLLRSIKPGVRVRDLCREYAIETLREYRERSRRQINDARQEGKRISTELYWAGRGGK